MPLGAKTIEADYRQSVAEITAYFEQEPPRPIPPAQRLALLSMLLGVYELGDCGPAANVAEPARAAA